MKLCPDELLRRMSARTGGWMNFLARRLGLGYEKGTKMIEDVHVSGDRADRRGGEEISGSREALGDNVVPIRPRTPSGRSVDSDIGRRRAEETGRRAHAASEALDKLQRRTLTVQSEVQDGLYEATDETGRLYRLRPIPLPPITDDPDVALFPGLHRLFDPRDFYVLAHLLGFGPLVRPTGITMVPELGPVQISEEWARIPILDAGLLAKPGVLRIDDEIEAAAVLLGTTARARIDYSLGLDGGIQLEVKDLRPDTGYSDPLRERWRGVDLSTRAPHTWESYSMTHGLTVEMKMLEWGMADADAAGLRRTIERIQWSGTGE